MNELDRSKMTNNTETLNDDEASLVGERQRKLKARLLLITGCLGVVMAAPFFLWVPLGLIGLTPSMIDVFGVVGLRFPAAVTIGGLLLAAVGFHEI
jgi:hypothetical protein